MARWLTGKNECSNGLTSVYKIYCHIIFPVCHCRISYTPEHTFKCRRRCRLHILPLTFRKTTPPNIISRNWTVFILRMPLRLRRFISQELIYEHKMFLALSLSLETRRVYESFKDLCDSEQPRKVIYYNFKYTSI